MRLKWVRNAEEVKGRLAEYPEEARAGVGEIQKVLGHQGKDEPLFEIKRCMAFGWMLGERPVEEIREFPK
jgi:hypothetical protein